MVDLELGAQALLIAAQLAPFGTERAKATLRAVEQYLDLLATQVAPAPKSAPAAVLIPMRGPLKAVLGGGSFSILSEDPGQS